MLIICERFGKEYNVLFNPEKYQLLHYSADKNNIINGIKHNDLFIKCVTQAVHLGHPMSTVNNDLNITKGVDSFLISVNGVINTFKSAHTDVKYKLFKTYCMPLYGCVLWDLSSKSMKIFYTQWRKSVRKLLFISPMCHSIYLELIVNDIPIELQIYKRVVKFFHSIFTSENKILSICGQLVLEGSNSSLCKNINLVCNKLNINKYQLSNSIECLSSAMHNYISKLYTDYHFFVTSNIKDLLQLRNVKNSRFSNTELNFMLDYFCTSDL